MEREPNCHIIISKTFKRKEKQKWVWGACRLKFKHGEGGGFMAILSQKEKENEKQSKVRPQRAVWMSMFISALLTPSKKYPYHGHMNG